MRDTNFVKGWVHRERRVARAAEEIYSSLVKLPPDKARRILNAVAAYYDLPPPAPRLTAPEREGVDG